MVVQHNLTAMNSNRMLGMTQSAQAKSSEKLSSGYRINRAADDAAGLTISEKMRKQINGLDQASTNAQDGVSAVQTAEGALTEVHSMLQRMNELAVQAANGTNSEDDRAAIQAEVDQLLTEIDRVAETTKFNETYLLKGEGTATKTLAVYDAGIKGTFGDVKTDGSYDFTPTLAAGDKITIDGDQYELVSETDAAKVKDGQLSIADALATNDKGVYKKLQQALTDANSVGGGTPTVGAFASGVFNVKPGTVSVPGALTFDLHVGADADMTNKISIDIESMGTANLGISGLKVDGDDSSNATYAIDAIAEAIKTVSSQRSALGAVQNRLEHTIDNLDNVVENTTAAESRIRDTDMAEEMVEYSKNNILAQAGQSMLAQANTATQGVLSLLG